MDVLSWTSKVRVLVRKQRVYTVWWNQTVILWWAGCRGRRNQGLLSSSWSQPGPLLNGVHITHCMPVIYPFWVSVFFFWPLLWGGPGFDWGEQNWPIDRTQCTSHLAGCLASGGILEGRPVREGSLLMPGQPCPTCLWGFCCFLFPLPFLLLHCFPLPLGENLSLFLCLLHSVASTGWIPG